MTRFQPGDRVRHFMPGRRRSLLGTVAPPEPWAAQLTWVNLDDTRYPQPLGFRPDDLQLAGTRCIPFHTMNAQQMRDHLRIAHLWSAAADHPYIQGDSGTAMYHLAGLHGVAELAHQVGSAAFPTPLPHTHRKEPRA